MLPAQDVNAAFQKEFGQAPALLIRAPGRVNLIGEHTDYNDGFVLPMAIDRAVWIAMRRRADRRVRAFSLDFNQWGEFDLGDYSYKDEGWLEYVKGVAWALQSKKYALAGWEGTIAGDIPIGAGLSSSAALELASARAFAAISGIGWDPVTMALISKQAENEWIKVNCGIMDQLISAAGIAGHALLIDCRSLERQAVPLPHESVVVVMDTGTRRGLVDSAYNQRRAQCEAAAAFFNKTVLRDVSLEEFREGQRQLDETIRKRARHVISENDRTLKAARAMQQGDAQTLGQLMNASHKSLRDDFEVSSQELDLIVNLAQSHRGCYGARMTGAGFGGCGVALVESGHINSFTDHIHRRFLEAIGTEARIYICQASDGAAIVSGERSHME